MSECAVFIFSGFLDSGKTTALRGVLEKDRTDADGDAVLLCTEEGEEVYDEQALKKLHVTLLCIDNEEDFDESYLEDIAADHSPENVYIEFNGMWDLGAFLEIPLPRGWHIANVFALADAQTYAVYQKNMRQTLMNPLRSADVILFNRCDDAFDKGNARRALRILNPAAEVFFTKEDGTIDHGIDDLLLPDTGGVLTIDEDLYCPWFVDCIEHADRYYGKKVRAVGMVTRGSELAGNRFYFGRYVAICCEADAQFVGFISQYDGTLPPNGAWIEIEAEIGRGTTADGQEVLLLGIESLRTVETPDSVFLYF